MEAVLKQKLANGKFENVPASRSSTMRAIKARGNVSTELCFRLAMVRGGIRGWKLHSAIEGRPDFFFIQSGIAVFLDGCFWHGCIRCGHVPKTRSAFWRMKISRTQLRDKKVNAYLTSNGIRVLRFWEHELQEQLSNCVDALVILLNDAKA
jgi:DNA mismatch endonuclease Vsr